MGAERERGWWIYGYFGFTGDGADCGGGEYGRVAGKEWGVMAWFGKRTARVVEEFLVLGRYRVMVLDREVAGVRRCRINGETFEPVPLGESGVPGNYLALRTTDSFAGAAVRFG